MIRNLVLVGLLGVFWGLNWPAVRFCLAEMTPWTLRSLGFTLATVLIFAIIRVSGLSAAVPRRHWARLAFVGLFTVVAYNMLSAFAQLTASTSRSAVLSYTMPIWAVLGARVVLGEPLDGRRLAGLALGASGLLALGWPLLLAGELTIGLLWAVLSGVVWAIASVFLKRWPVAAPPLVIAAWQLALGAVVTTAGMLLVDGWPARWPQRPETWWWFGYHVAFAQVAATSLWFTILGRMPAGIASIASLLVPAIGVIGAATLVGERPSLADWLGLLLIVAASATVLLRPPPPEPRPALAA